MMLAQDAGGSISDFAQSQQRRVEDLLSAEHLATLAAERARGSLGAKAVDSRRCPVLFEPRTAATLVGELAGR
ncbi:hypothetical protein P0F65_12315 [Sphingomonas sp. I4]